MLGRKKHIHFIGIGGIGMSGIAEVLINQGFDVSGSDIERSRITERLSSLGATIHYGHSEKHVAGTDVVVFSSAIDRLNPELVYAKEHRLPVIPRSDMLGELMRLKTGIAVAGAHGKTSTTSLAAAVLEAAGLDPTVVVGGQVKSLKANVRLGQGRFLVAEADESDGNFVRLSPFYAIITNIDEEHLDFYGGLKGIYDAFVSFAKGVPFDGAVICCIDDPRIRTIVPRIDRRIVTYGFDEGADVQGTVTEAGQMGTSFTVKRGGVVRETLFLNMPGRHNVLNALGVVALAGELGIDTRHVKKALHDFEGISRRFEIKGEAGGVLFVDDYGHHPTEVQATIQAARESYVKRLVVVFQPHRYTRTRDLGERFRDCFDGADEVFITGIYPAGESPIPGISGEIVYRAARRGGAGRISYMKDREDLKSAVRSCVREGDLVLTLGAGDIWKLGEELLEERRSAGA